MSSRAAKRDLSYLQSIPLKDENRLTEAAKCRRTRMDRFNIVESSEPERLYENRRSVVWSVIRESACCGSVLHVAVGG